MITEPSNDTDITPLPIKREPRQKLTNAREAGKLAEVSQ